MCQHRKRHTHTQTNLVRTLARARKCAPLQSSATANARTSKWIKSTLINRTIAKAHGQHIEQTYTLHEQDPRTHTCTHMQCVTPPSLHHHHGALPAPRHHRTILPCADGHAQTAPDWKRIISISQLFFSTYAGVCPRRRSVRSNVPIPLPAAADAALQRRNGGDGDGVGEKAHG